MADKTKMAGVIGWPVSHSLSPKLHGYWLKQYGIDGSYLPLAVRPEDLKDTIESLPKKHYRGVNLTIPHKEKILPMLDDVDEIATAIGAVNTIVVENGKLCGTNTDAYGFSENIKPHLPAGRNKAVVLGAGGAARAVCYALHEIGFSRILVVNRTVARGAAMADRMEGNITVEPWEKRAQILEGADVLVNTTSLGMAGGETLTIDLAVLPKHALVTDIVYTPLMTPLLQQASARGNPVVDGLGMLLHQAVPGFEAWFGVRPDVTDGLRHHVLNG